MQYWVVKLEAAAFDTEAEARAFQEALSEAFMQMPEAEEIAATVSRESVSEVETKSADEWLNGGE